MKIKYMPRKVINNQKLKRPRSKRSMRRFTVVFLLGLSLVLGMIFSGWVRWKQTELVFNINQTKIGIDKLKEEKKQLLMKLSNLQSHERVAGIARDQLGMEQVSVQEIIIVDVEESENETKKKDSKENSLDSIAFETAGEGD